MKLFQTENDLLSKQLHEINKLLSFGTSAFCSATHSTGCFLDEIVQEDVSYTKYDTWKQYNSLS